MTLAKIVEENIGKPIYEMKRFFQELVDNQKLIAYVVELNKQTIERDTKEEKIIKIKKGLSLTPTKKIDEICMFIENPPKNDLYSLSITSRGGMFFNDGNSQTTYDRCLLEKLKRKPNPEEVSKNCDILIFSNKLVIATLDVNHEEYWENDRIQKTSGHLVIAGEQDSLFDKFYEFLKAK